MFPGSCGAVVLSRNGSVEELSVDGSVFGLSVCGLVS